MQSRAFLPFARALVKGDIDFDTVTFKILAVTVAPTVSELDTWATRSAIANELPAGSGYATGGVDVGFTLNASDTTNHRIPITFTDNATAWTGITATNIAGFIIYTNTGNAATDIPAYWILPTSITQPGGGNLPLAFTAPAYLQV